MRRRLKNTDDSQGVMIPTKAYEVAMSKFLTKMERKYGRYAIPHLTYFIIGFYVIGYALTLMNSDIASYMTLEPYYILHGQIWRIFTWIVVPPSSFSIWTIIMLFFYLSVGQTLEKAWGDFRYNIYIFGGMILSLIAAFVCYLVLYMIAGTGEFTFGTGSTTPFSTYYICLSIFLGFAATFPDVQVLLYFVIPLKVKWLGIVYVAFIAYDVIQYMRIAISGNILGWVYVIGILVSLLNCLIFFLSTKNMKRYSPGEIKRRAQFKKAMNNAGPTIRPQQRSTAYGTGASNNANTGKRQQNVARHRCDICGKTELTNPEMDFRYCSKCAGAHEYCQDHLFTHVHIKL